MRKWFRRFMYVLRQSRHDAELREEIEAHRSLRQAHLEREGLRSSDAEAVSRRALGNVLLVRDDVREAWLGSCETWWQDARYGLRMVRRSPGLATIVMLTMAAGVGINAAIFGVFHAVLLRPLPYPDADRLVWVATHDPRFNQDTFVSRSDFLIWRDRASSFERMAAYGHQDVAVRAENEAAEQRVTSVTSDMWSITGAHAAIGRLFGPGEENVAVLSYTTFEREFGGHPAAVGRSLSLNGHAVTVVGVLARDYQFVPTSLRGVQTTAPAAYIPLSETPGPPGSQDLPGSAARPVPPWVSVIGKLRRDVSLEHATSEMRTVFSQVVREYDSAAPLRLAREGYSLRVVPLQEKIVGPVETPLKLLLAAAVFVLLIATTNIAHLLLARAVSRQTEIATRVALGAGRTRIIRQLLSESLWLAAAGCGAGLVIAHLALDAVVRLWPHAIPHLEGATINMRVLTFALAAALMSTLLFGLAPRVALQKTDLTHSLKREGRGASSTPAVARVRRLLVSVELALATALLIGAGLMLKSFWLMSAGPAGLEPEKILVTRVSLSGPRYASRIPQEQYVQELLRRLEGMPGIAAAGIDTGSFHVSVGVNGITPIPSEPASAAGQGFVTIKPVSLGFLRAMGIPLIHGSWPTDGALKSDAVESTDALLVNQRFVDMMMHDQDPIGRHVSGPYLSGTIAGVVADFKDWQLDSEPPPQVYVPFKRSMALRSVRVVIRTDGNPYAAAPFARETIAQIDRSQAIAEFATLDDVLASSVSNRRFSLSMLSLFAGVALFLALTGAYGVIAHSIAQRAREIGIRIALGAGARTVVSMVVRNELRAALTGIAAGLLGALALAPVMASLLYGVLPRDPATFIAVGAALASAALLTSWIAAGKAASIDPIGVLKE